MYLFLYCIEKYADAHWMRLLFTKQSTCECDLIQCVYMHMRLGVSTANDDSFLSHTDEDDLSLCPDCGQSLKVIAQCILTLFIQGTFTSIVSGVSCDKQQTRVLYAHHS